MPEPVIWYLHHTAGSPSLGMSYRPYYLSKEFNQHGYRSYVIGANFHHLLHKPIEQKQIVKQEKIDGQDYIFLKTLPYSGNFKRFLNMLSYSWKIWRYQKKLIQITGAPSVIIVSSSHLFHYFSARSIAKKYNAKLIFEVRDLWPLSFIDLLSYSPWHPMVLFMGLIERKAYKNADYVVSLLPYAFSYMSQRGLTQDRFISISNGVAVNEVLEEKQPLLAAYEEQIHSKKQNGQFIIGYVGAHGVPNSLDDLLQALIVLKRENIKNIHVILVGNGAQKKELIQLAEDNHLESITFLDPIPKKQIPSFLHLMDAVYLGWKNRSIYQYGISPNKLFDYMLSGKPILHAFSGENDIVEQTKTGFTVEAENPISIAKGIQQMMNTTKAELDEMGRHGREAALANFSYEYLAKNYMQLFGKD